VRAGRANGPVQPRDRRSSVHQHGHRQGSCGAPAHQARGPWPGPARHRRLPGRPGRRRRQLPL